MLYAAIYADGSREILEAVSLSEAKAQAKKAYDAPVRCVTALDAVVTDEDDDDERNNPDDEEDDGEDEA